MAAHAFDYLVSYQEMRLQYVKQRHSSTNLYTCMLLFHFRWLYFVSTATGEMKKCIIAAFTVIYESLFNVEILKWVTISFTIFWDDTFHCHRDGLTSHGGTYLDTIGFKYVFIKKEYTMAFILVI